jgi:hypothetical protein
MKLYEENRRGFSFKPGMETINVRCDLGIGLASFVV